LILIGNSSNEDFVISKKGKVARLLSKPCSSRKRSPPNIGFVQVGALNAYQFAIARHRFSVRV